MRNMPQEQFYWSTLREDDGAGKHGLFCITGCHKDQSQHHHKLFFALVAVYNCLLGFIITAFLVHTTNFMICRAENTFLDFFKAKIYLIESQIELTRNIFTCFACRKLAVKLAEDGSFLQRAAWAGALMKLKLHSLKVIITRVTASFWRLATSYQTAQLA